MRELTEAELFEVAAGLSQDEAGAIGATLAAGAAMTGTYTLVPGPHTVVAGAITAVMGLGAAGFGLYAAYG